MTTETDRYNRYWRERRDTQYTPVRPRHRIIADYITAHSQRYATVLDLGCGEGHILNRVPGDRRRYGCDISPIPLKMITDSMIVTTTCDLNAKWPEFGALNWTGSDTYDFIVASELLEHMQLPETLLTRIHWHLSPNGQFLCTIPNVWHWQFLWPRLHGKRPHYDPTHCHFWTLPEFRAILRKHGFQVISSQPTITITPARFPKWLRYLITRIPFTKYLTGEQWLFVCRRKQ